MGSIERKREVDRPKVEGESSVPLTPELRRTLTAFDELLRGPASGVAADIIAQNMFFDEPGVPDSLKPPSFRSPESRQRQGKNTTTQ